jgi:hypothetical protein
MLRHAAPKAMSQISSRGAQPPFSFVGRKKDEHLLSDQDKGSYGA